MSIFMDPSSSSPRLPTVSSLTPESADSKAPPSPDPPSSRNHSGTSLSQQGKPREKPRVQWRAGETLDSQNKRAVFELPSDSDSEEEVDAQQQQQPQSRSRSTTPPLPRGTHSPSLLDPASATTPRNTHASRRLTPPQRPSPPQQRPSYPPPTALRQQKPAIKKPQEHAYLEKIESESSGDDTGQEIDAEAIRQAARSALSQQSAQNRAERLSRSIGTRSAPGSRYASPVRAQRVPQITETPQHKQEKNHSSSSPSNPSNHDGAAAAVKSPPPSPALHGHQPNLDMSDIPLEKLESRRQYGIEDDKDDPRSRFTSLKRPFLAVANKYRERHVQPGPLRWFKFHSSYDDPALKSGQSTPVYERDPDDYVPRPKQYREGFVGPLMRLYHEQGASASFTNLPALGYEALRHRRNYSTTSLDSGASTPAVTPPAGRLGSPGSSGSASPRSSSFRSSITGIGGGFGGGRTPPKVKQPKWYENPFPHSTGSIAELVSSSTSLAHPGAGGRTGRDALRPMHQRHQSQSGSSVKSTSRGARQTARDAVLAMGGKRKSWRTDEAIKIQIHLADTMQRKAFLLKICRALMAYGAPTHRLEEYMRMCARVLEIDGHFLYIPGCMIISFGDAAWQTSDVRIVRVTQAVNLAKLYDTHDVYKQVIHDRIGPEEGIERLEKISRAHNRYNPWTLVIMYGLASVCVGPFAFGARPIDLPMCFVLGCVLGFMQLILAPRSDLYANIFEISASVLTSFLARALGSINGGKLFCFSALAQSSIVLILPGYTVLCGALELQSKNMVAGSVRMVYAIIYSLFLGFGITVGTSIYGAIDSNATSATQCDSTWPFWWQLIFVMPFTLCLVIINQGKWKKMPPMLLLAMVGYLVNHYSAKRFSSNAQIAQTLGALAIGVIANMYSRLRHGLAAAVLLPAIFVQVPSGLAASGSLISGVTSANQITNHTTSGTGSSGSSYGGVNLGMTSNSVNNATTGQGVEINSPVLNVGYSMIQIAIGITVGLFLSALVVYPLGKRRSGLFSF